jgi:hypothetical protein
MCRLPADSTGGAATFGPLALENVANLSLARAEGIGVQNDHVFVDFGHRLTDILGVRTKRTLERGDVGLTYILVHKEL